MEPMRILCALLPLIAACSSPTSPKPGCENQPCQTSADCRCDNHTCTGRGACKPTSSCLHLPCGSDSDCCLGDYCAAGTCAATIDLVLGVDRPAANPGDNDVVETFTIGNLGAATTGRVAFTFATPTYVGVSRAAPLPAGCVLLYENTDITVPEVVRCELAGVAHGQQLALPIHLAVSDKAPATATTGAAIVMPVPDSHDRELAILDNIATPGVNVANTGAPPAGNVNLFLAYTVPALGGPLAAVQKFAVGNNAGTPTQGSATLTVSTPFFANLDRARPLPAGCALLFENALPDVPEIVRCTLMPGLARGQPASFELPLVPVAGGPIGFVPGIAAVAVGAASNDIDIDRNDNVAITLSLLLEPQPFFAAAFSRDSTAPHALSRRPNASMAARAFRAPAAHATIASIDLNIGFGVAVARAGERTTQTLIITNRGDDMTGDMRMVYVPPLYVNIDRSRPLPGACQFLYENADFTVPEIVACTMPGVSHGGKTSVVMPLQIAPQAPSRRGAGQAVVLPAPGSSDLEHFMNDNIVHPLVTVAFNPELPPPPASGNLVDLYVTGGYPNLLMNGTADMSFRIGNKGPNTTRAPTRLTVSTPLFVNIDRARGLPAGCQFLSQNSDPAVPEIVDCLVPAGLMPRSEVEVVLPIQLLPGGSSGLFGAANVVRPASDLDVEIALADNTGAHGVIVSQPTP